MLYLASRKETGPFVVFNDKELARIFMDAQKMSVRPDNVPGIDFYQYEETDLAIDGITIRVPRHGKYLFWVPEKIARELLPREKMMQLN